jgi:hypothetical protein
MEKKKRRGRRRWSRREGTVAGDGVEEMKRLEREAAVIFFISGCRNSRQNRNTGP